MANDQILLPEERQGRPQSKDLDSDGYPTELALKAIREWPVQDAKGCLDYIQSLWHWGKNWASNPMEGRYRFATGGWSGNESLLGALRDNKVIWSMCWRFSARGGLEVYDLPGVKLPDPFYEP